MKWYASKYYGLNHSRKEYLKHKKDMKRFFKMTERLYDDWQSQRYKEGIWCKPLSSVRERNYIRRCLKLGKALTKRHGG